MQHAVRRLVSSSVLAAALVASGLGAVQADEVDPGAPTDPGTEVCADESAAVEDASAAVRAAKDAFVASRRPMGQLLKAERAEARTEIASSRQALKALQKHQTTGKMDKAARDALRALVRAERADIKSAGRLLASPKVLLAQVKAEQGEAKEAFREARSELKDARADLESCSGEDDGDDEPDEPDEGDDDQGDEPVEPTL